MSRPVSTVLLEALMIGAVLIPVMLFVFYGYRTVAKKNLNIYWTAFLSGALIHVLFELGGINQYYCETLWPDSKSTTVQTKVQPA